MELKQYKVGDRVKHEYLGIGTIEKINGMHLVGMALVKWDNKPPLRYNMGENPTVAWINELSLVENGEM